MDWETVGGIASLLTIVLIALKWGRNIVSWSRRLLIPAGATLPRQTIRIVQHPHTPWWHMGSASGKPAMQLASHWYVTNITDRTVHVLAARLLRPRTDGMVSTRHPDRDIYGTFPIAPGATKAYGDVERFELFVEEE